MDIAALPTLVGGGGARRAAARRRPAVALIIAGTRPECIKLAPLIRELTTHGRLQPCVVNSGQHVATVRQTLIDFKLRCDHELTALPSPANLAAACRDMQTRLTKLIHRVRPAITVVQGDTLTAYAGARAACAAGYPVAHVEAGLRTDTVTDPFPEELFRRQIVKHAHLHFAPCRSAERNLLREGVESRYIHRVGNTGIDSLRELLAQHDDLRKPPATDHHVLVTLHRRENLDGNGEILCDALLDLVTQVPQLRLVFPVHPNPRSSARIRRRLGGHPSIALVDPLSYPEFIRSAASAVLLISDSGGLQEEAPHLGVPLLVPRANTERPEGVATGFVRLVPIDRTTIVRSALEMLAVPRRPGLPFDHEAPFGAGDAAARIVKILESTLFAPTRDLVAHKTAPLFGVEFDEVGLA